MPDLEENMKSSTFRSIFNERYFSRVLFKEGKSFKIFMIIQFWPAIPLAVI